MKKQFYLENVTDNDIIDNIELEIRDKYRGYNIDINKQKHILSIDNNSTFNQNDIDTIISIINTNDPNIKVVEKEVVSTYRRVLILEGLDCANCAAKVERIARRNLDHEMIVVDFVSSRFIIETTNSNLDNIQEIVQDIARTVDSKIVVTTKTQEPLQKEEKVKISIRDKFTFFIGVGLFIIGLITEYSLGVFFGFDLPYSIAIPAFGLAYILLANDVIYSAMKNIINGRVFDEKFLMTLATVIALGIGHHTEAVSVMIFYKLGLLLQEYAVNKSRRSIASLMDIRPTHANLIVNGEIVEVDPLQVVEGDIILVKAGERIPLDGEVVEGEASLDVSALTGESKYLDAEVGTEVISGSINTNGMIKIRVNKIYEDSMVAKILNMVENASSLKSKSENFISKFAKYYTPTIVGLAVLLSLSPFVTQQSPIWSDFEASIYSAMVFLVASCPCALVISIPLGFFGGIGGASKHGILVKGSNYLEALSNVGSIIFDKTGTLTKGCFKVEEIVPSVGSKEELLEIAAYSELASNHPIATSIVNEYGKDRIDTSRVKIHPKSSKFGLRVYFDDAEIAVGNDNFMNKIKIKYAEIQTDGVVVHVVKDMNYIGYLIIKDEVRAEAKATISKLKAMGIKTAMFTGDKDIVAKEVAESVGIDIYYANMTPIDKVKKLRQIKRKFGIKNKQVFVGDGINDAPVLSSADIGIAMGGLGSDAAIKVADVVLMTDDLTKLPKALMVARKTKRIVIQNIILALTVKVIVLSLAPLGITHMWEAIFADVGVSLIAIINSLRAANIKKESIIKLKQ